MGILTVLAMKIIENYKTKYSSFMLISVVTVESQQLLSWYSPTTSRYE